MIKKYQNNYIQLVVIHLLLLIYPLISKTVHVHQDRQKAYVFSNHIALNQPKEFCPIYDFEFYNFVATEQLISITDLKSIPAYTFPEPKIHFVPVLSYFSLRAPPAT